MIGQQVAPTNYDLRFQCFGFPVRVNPWFWAAAAFLVWTERLDETLVGMTAVFLSILIHELGHAFAGRYYGGRSEIVLHLFGGYATRNVDPSRLGNILISAAGPAAGLAFWGILFSLIRLSPEVMLRSSPYLTLLVGWLLLINLYWSLMNLLPVWPLDGGQIAHQVIGRFRTFDAWELTLKLSILVCAGIVAWCVFEFAQHGDTDRWLLILFGMLAFQNIQALQMSSRGRW